MDNTTQLNEDVSSFTHGNIEAITKSSQIWAAGMQDISKAMSVMMQAQLEQAMATCKALASVKSLKEAMEIQGGYVQACMQHAMSETGKLNDASARLLEQTIAPIKDHMSGAMEKLSRAAASPLSSMASSG